MSHPRTKAVVKLERSAETAAVAPLLARQVSVAEWTIVAIVEPGAFLTEILGKVTEPDDVQRAASYGEYQRIAQEAPKRIAERATGNDPANIAKTILQLANTAPRERPLRSVVPPNPAVESINSTLASIQRGLVESLGVDALIPKAPVAS